MHDGLRVHDPFPHTVSAAIVFLNISYLCTGSNKEPVNAIMLTGLCTPIVDSAACYDRHIGILSNVKVIIYSFGKSRLAYDDRYMYAFTPDFRLYYDINTRTIFFRYDINVFRSSTFHALSIGTDIESSSRNFMQSGITGINEKTAA